MFIVGLYVAGSYDGVNSELQRMWKEAVVT
jgi:hypothetical protein